ncbi:preprotein translocase subunit YajC [Novosphingobium bradum]|uniref:Preprotein translocase subunit YajC n=1 Tax=Novosphingobium bradum TaxID=1737444 RepID=A0ABV7IVB7_9SPHN
MNRSKINAMLAGVMLAALAVPGGAGAQSLSYGKASVGGGEGAGSAEAASDDADAAAPAGGHRGRHGRARLSPYIEAAQVISAQLAPSHDVLTWSSLAAGVDGGLDGRNTQASFSVRYERRFGYGKADDGDTLSGLARASVGLIPRTLSLEAGALATRTSSDGGAALPGGVNPGQSTRLWSAYAGPSLATHAGDVAVNGAYRIGYTEVGSPGAVVAPGAAANVDLFDHSVTQMASLHAGTAPGDALPVGVGIGGGWYREDISNLDQRINDLNLRADLAVPVSDTVSLVGGVGYEKVRVSSRDAAIDPITHLPVVQNGRYVTDKSAPRRIAYDTSGLIWDAGVTWRPSRRTALEAHVGRRYGSTTWYGSFGWRATRRSALNISVYDSIAGLGGELNRALVELPTDFEVNRNAVTGDINGCVAARDPATTKGSACLTGALGGLRSATFRSRGIQASWSVSAGRLGWGVGAGYDRRKFIAAPGTVLASANGLLDENAWVSAWLNGQIDRSSSFATFAYVDWFQSRLDGNDGTAIGANASYGRSLGDHLSANAALSIQGIQRSKAPDTWDASAMLGLRYSFF